MKTSELTGAALDWAVAKAEGRTDVRIDDDGELVGQNEFDYSTDWSQGGQIIEREQLCVGFQHQLDPEYVPLIDPDVMCWARNTAGGYLKYGPTPLIAAMRCYVASKLGDDIEIPKELT